MAKKTYNILIGETDPKTIELLVNSINFFLNRITCVISNATSFDVILKNMSRVKKYDIIIIGDLEPIKNQSAIFPQVAAFGTFKGRMPECSIIFTGSISSTKEVNLFKMLGDLKFFDHICEKPVVDLKLVEVLSAMIQKDL